mmetsp:Transcript_54837/g.141278  ORF Transcript_54837/g.141278 Transcript_54837/m.141278 type:complete len:417 (+) Transcript_54837:692-1942(+)
MLLALLGIGGALVALHRDPALLAIHGGLCLDACQAPGLVLRGTLEDLKGLALLQLADGLPRSNVEGRGDGDTIFTDQELGELQVCSAGRLLHGAPTALAILRAPDADPDALERVLLSRPLEDLEDLALRDLPDLGAGAFVGRLQARALLAAKVGLGSRLHEAAALVALERGPALLHVHQRAALDARETCGAIHLLRLQDFDELAGGELPESLALLHLEHRGDRNVLDTPLIILHHAAQCELRDASGEALHGQIQLGSLQARAGDLLHELPRSLGRHQPVLTAHLCEEVVGRHTLFQRVRAQRLRQGKEGVVRDQLLRGLQRSKAFLARGLQPAYFHLHLDECGAALAHRAPDSALHVVEVRLDFGLRLGKGRDGGLKVRRSLVHGLERVIFLRPAGFRHGIRWRQCLAHGLLLGTD